jgi:hypothetical protein
VFSGALGTRLQPRTYKKDTRTRMIAIEGDDSPVTVWCMDGMKCS